MNECEEIGGVEETRKGGGFVWAGLDDRQRGELEMNRRKDGAAQGNSPSQQKKITRLHNDPDRQASTGPSWLSNLSDGKKTERERRRKELDGSGERLAL